MKNVSCARGPAFTIAIIVAAVLSIVTVPSAHAWNGNTKVASVIAQPYAELLVKFTNAPAHACWNPPDGFHEYLYKIGGHNATGPDLTPYEKIIYTTLLSANLASRDIFVVTGGQCEYGYERIYLINTAPQ